MGRKEPTYRLNAGIHFAKTEDGRFVIFQSQTGEYYGLDEVGSVFFEEVLDNSDISEVLSELRSRYPDAEPIQLEGDLRQFLRKLVRYKILVKE
jgi:hypothetical protein